MQDDIKELYEKRAELIALEEQNEESRKNIEELTQLINKLLDEEIKKLTASREAPEMTNEGQKNTLIYLLSAPDPKRVKQDIDFLERMSVQYTEIQGFKDLTPEQQAALNKEVLASNYLLSLALEILASGSGISTSYDILPSSPSLYILNEFITANNKKRVIKTTPKGRKLNDRHKSVIYNEVDEGISISQIQERTGEEVNITLTNCDQLQGKGVKKCYAFLLAQSNKQNFSPVIGFSLQELVEKGMYSNIDNARRGIKNGLDTLQHIQISGTVKRGKKSIEQAAGILFYHYTIKNNYVEVFVNENINIEFIASYFALLPVFSYSLTNSNSFDICEYVFLQARQNTKAIREKGSFNVSFKRIQELLSLPLPEDLEEGRKYKPKQYVITPILTAIDEIKSKALEVGNIDFSIKEVYNPDYKSLNEFLEGYIEITITGELGDKLKALADKQEAKIAAAIAYRKKLAEAREKKK